MRNEHERTKRETLFGTEEEEPPINAAVREDLDALARLYALQRKRDTRYDPRATTDIVTRLNAAGVLDDDGMHEIPETSEPQLKHALPHPYNTHDRFTGEREAQAYCDLLQRHLGTQYRFVSRIKTVPALQTPTA